MKYFIIFFLFVIITCSEKRTANEKFWDWFQYCTMGFGSSTSSSYKVVDKADGTLEVVSIYDTTFCFQYKTQYRYSTQNIIKKCIQGQVYRTEQNDCKGKGTAADWWGAEKFQWCPTNDWACATLNSSGFYVNDYTKIPAFVTCKNDNTANMKWTLISLDYNDRLAHFRYMQANRLEEVPMGDSFFYWRTGFEEDSEKAVFSLTESWVDSKTFTYVPKNTFQYVLCQKIKGV